MIFIGAKNQLLEIRISSEIKFDDTLNVDR